MIYSELDMKAEARAEFEHLAKDNFHLHRFWLGSLSFLADVCAYLGDAARAAVLNCCSPTPATRLRLARPSRVTEPLHGISGYWPSPPMAKWEDAAQHFEDALEMNARMNARPWLAYTQHQYADMLLSRQQRGDHHKATSLLHEALNTACELGMRTLEAHITASLESLSTSPQGKTSLPR